MYQIIAVLISLFFGMHRCNKLPYPSLVPISYARKRAVDKRGRFFEVGYPWQSFFGQNCAKVLVLIDVLVQLSHFFRLVEYSAVEYSDC